MTKWKWGGLILVAALIAVAFLHPTSRTIIVGLFRGERTYRFKPTSYWARTLTDRNEQEANESLELLKKGGAQAVPVLVEALGSEDAQVRLNAAAALGAIGTDAVPALAKAMESDEDVVRIGAARALQRIGPNASSATSALYSALWDAEPLVVIMSVTALGSIGKENTRVLINVVEGHRSVDVRVAALDGLGKIGPDAAEAVELLRKLIDDNNERISKAAGEALKKIDAEAAKKAGFD